MDIATLPTQGTLPYLLELTPGSSQWFKCYLLERVRRVLQAINKLARLHVLYLIPMVEGSYWEWD